MSGGRAPRRKRWSRSLRRIPLLLLVSSGGRASARAPDDWFPVANALDPHGPYAGRIADLWWVLLAVASIVFVIVAALFAIGFLRPGRDATEGGDTGERRSHPWIVFGTVLTALVLLLTTFLTFDTMAALATPEERPAHTLEIVGHQWWWEVRYEGETIGANEIHLPVGQPVELRLSSDDVIHSLWVPQLVAKRDLVPGHPTAVWIEADEAGAYRGVCAEFCGVQHAKMGLIVVAEDPAAFEAWLARSREDAVEPEGEGAVAGRAVFDEVGCSTCHTIRGTDAAGVLGPDLTHLASRRTLAAGHLPNTRGHLGGWIVDAQGIKPGSLMPPQDVSGGALQDLLDYLTGLE
jgi:cytochrome c oxidase subunit II